MTYLTASLSLDIDKIDFSLMKNGFVSSLFTPSNNANNIAAAPKKDIYTFAWFLDDFQTAKITGFSGTDFSISKDIFYDKINSGNVRNYFEFFAPLGGQDNILHYSITDANFSLVKWFDNWNTVSRIDDIDFLSQIFAQNDTISGSEFDDNLKAFSGDDFIFGSNGNDRMDGGDGIDTASYIGLVSEFDFSQTANGLIIRDLVKNRNGDDNLSGVEFITFDDAELLSSHEASKDVYLAYSILGRKPTSEELLSWSKYYNNNKMSIQELSHKFLSSDEFSKILEPLNKNNIDDYLDILYLNILGRNRGEEDIKSGDLGLSKVSRRANLTDNFAIDATNSLVKVAVDLIQSNEHMQPLSKLLINDLFIL